MVVQAQSVARKKQEEYDKLKSEASKQARANQGNTRTMPIGNMFKMQ